MVTEIKNPVKDALKKAKEEIAKEEQERMVKQFKSKLKEVHTTEVILKNLKRELEELEQTIGEL